MPLMALALERDYRSDVNRIGSHFFGTVLPEANRYDRAVGFFSSSVFTVEPEAWLRFFSNGGRMRLVCSPLMKASDVDALLDAVTDRPRWRRRSLEDVFAKYGHGPATSNILATLVARDLLAMKIAIPQGANAIYHEKIAIVADFLGHYVATTGSVNESSTAWIDNFERLDIFRSWSEVPQEAERASAVRRDFERLWKNETDGLSVISVAQAVLDGKLEPRSSDLPVTQGQDLIALPKLPRVAEVLVPPDDLTLLPHQERAIAEWAKAGGRGILEMATGSGKTLTALSLASKLYDGIGPGLAIIIAAPLLALVDQWVANARRFGLHPIRCAESSAEWSPQFSTAIDALNSGSRAVLSVITTAATLGSDNFVRHVDRIRKPALMIGDEAHTYGSYRLANALPAVPYRLGLSATPERWGDEEGTRRIKEYFGRIVYSYTLADAIRDGVLTPYRYYPMLVSFTHDEFEEYMRLTKLIGRYAGEGADPESANDVLKALLYKRSRLIATADAKQGALRELLVTRTMDANMLVYAGDGSVAGPTGDELTKQTAAVAQMVGNDLGMRCATYTHATPPERRQELLREFERGLLQVLIAIRCLDEGVDVPATRVAVLLASATNPRQFVQRRGRVLRKAPGKARAEVFDMFVAPPLSALDGTNQEIAAARGLVKSQMLRASEFAALAENGPSARRVLNELLAPLRMLDAWEGT